MTEAELNDNVRAGAQRANGSGVDGEVDSEILGAGFQALAESLPQIVWILDSAGNNHYVNQRWTDFTGLNQQESSGGGWASAVHAEDQNRVSVEWQNGVKSGEPFELEYRLRIRSGEHRWVMARGIPLFTKDGRLYGWLGTCTDVHSTRVAEQRVQERETHLRILAESIPQMVWTADADGNQDWTNKRWCDFTGQTLEESVGAGWTKAVHPEDYERTVAAWNTAWLVGGDYEVTCRIRRADGLYFWHLERANAIRDESGKIVKWFGTCTNIDDNTKASRSWEQQVEERTNELKTIASMLSEFVETGDFRRASQRILQLALELTRGEYGFVGTVVPGGPQGRTLRVFADQGFNWSSTVNRELYDKVAADYDLKGYIDFPQLDNLFGWPIINQRAIIANDVDGDSRRSGRQPLGHPPIKSFLGVPIMKGDTVLGAFGVANRRGGFSEEQVKSIELLAGAACVIYEGYKRHQREHALLKERDLAESRLKESNRLLLDLAYSVSHEMQGPLRIIRSELGLLSVRYSDRLGTDADEFIRNSVKAAGVVNRMVDGLWEYARIDRPHIQFEEIDLNEIFDKTSISLEQLVEQKKAIVSRENLPRVRGERRQMEALFRQLVSNALIHNRSSVPTATMSVSQLVDQWLFCVTDNGIGIDSTETQEIFKMFRKLDRDNPGSGMGLAIAKRIVEFHGGKLRVDSTRGVGSRFCFTLPMVSVR